MFEAQQRNSVLSPRPSSVSSVQSNASSSSQRGRQGSRRDDEICVGEEVKIAVEIALQRFRLSEELKGSFPVGDSMFCCSVSTLILTSCSKLTVFKL